MKVHELIAILQELEPDADVYIMSQPNYPFEHAVRGVSVREDFSECEQGETKEAAGDRWTARASELPGNDVFILEGEQLRYGSREAWRAHR
jgi:hypothetical protein